MTERSERPERRRPYLLWLLIGILVTLGVSFAVSPGFQDTVRTQFRILFGKQGFALETLAVSPEHPMVGDVVVFSARVRNRGAGGTDNLSLRVDGELTRIREISLEAREEAVVPFRVSFDHDGDHQVEIRGQHAEGILRKRVDVGPLILVEGLEVPKSAITGETVEIGVRLRNRGLTDGSLPLTLTVDGQEMGTKAFSVNSGASVIGRFAATFPEPGRFQVTIDRATAEIEVWSATVSANVNRQALEIASREVQGQNSFGAEYLRTVTVFSGTDGTYRVVVDYNADNDRSAGEIKLEMERVMRRLYRAFYSNDLNVSQVSVAAYLPVEVQAGEIRTQVVYRTMLDRERARQIDWTGVTLADLRNTWELEALNPQLFGGS